MRAAYDDPELYDKALKAYFAWYMKTGDTAYHPSRDFCEIGVRYVYLRNRDRLLAKYNIVKGTIEIE